MDRERAAVSKIDHQKFGAAANGDDLCADRPFNERRCTNVQSLGRQNLGRFDRFPDHGFLQLASYCFDLG